MEITAAMVKKLREMTGSGVMACKKALVETDGDYDKAVELLREKGEATAVKKAGRIAAEGIVMVSTDGDKKAAIVEVNSETDFVAKNEKFRTFVANVADQALTTNTTDVDSFLAEAWTLDSSKTVKEELVSQIAVIGENMTIRRFEKIATDGVVVPYIHGAGRIGVLVEASTSNAGDEVKDALKNVAMQIAAMNPQYIKREDISDDEIASLRKITIESALNDPASLPKPILNKLIEKAVNDKVWSDEDIAVYEEKKSNMNYLFNFLSEDAKKAITTIALADKDEIMANKIFGGLVEGRISKQIKEISLYDQTYVKAEDGKQSVKAYLASVESSLVITKMVRYEVGEGIEKKQEDFAEEVAKQMA